MRRIRDYSVKELATVALPVALAIGAAFWFTFKFVQPAPPRVVVMSTGAEGGAYHAFALRYKTILARDGVTLELRPSSGAVENLARLRDPKSDVSLAFVQGGIGDAADPPLLESLGSVYYEPLWVFYRGKREIDRINDFKGKRIAVGSEGSGTRKLAHVILDTSGLRPEDGTLLDIGGQKAADALIAGTADVLFIVAGPEAPLVRKLVRADGVKLMSFARAAAYAARHPFLHKLVLPRGTLDIARDLPREDVLLIAPTANLLAKESLHPAIAYLVLEAAHEVHSGPGPFNRIGEFPSPNDVEFPLSSQAERYYRSGPPFLQRYLPFWAASLIDRMVVLLLPLCAVAVPLFRILPGLYAWRIRRKVYRWYGELKFLEEELRHRPPGDDPADELARLAKIEDEVSEIHVPLGFAHEVYTLRMHIKLVRELLERPPGPATARA
jgi:TRAP transporter TAXI family solute receptor